MHSPPHSKYLKQPVRRISSSSSVDFENVEAFEGYHGVVELLVFFNEDFLLPSFTNQETGVAPTELVHEPEGIDGKEEAVYWV
ncbi:hypothetical protein M378DRAFT_172100, partial [Amanita muscaria Koide BX008]